MFWIEGTTKRFKDGYNHFGRHPENVPRFLAKHMGGKGMPCRERTSAGGLAAFVGNSEMRRKDGAMTSRTFGPNSNPGGSFPERYLRRSRGPLWRSPLRGHRST